MAMQQRPYWQETNRALTLNALYHAAGRDNPAHPYHATYTGLWQEFATGVHALEWVPDDEDKASGVPQPETTLAKFPRVTEILHCPQCPVGLDRLARVGLITTLDSMPPLYRLALECSDCGHEFNVTLNNEEYAQFSDFFFGRKDIDS